MTTAAIQRVHLPFWPAAVVSVLAWLVAWFGTRQTGQRQRRGHDRPADEAHDHDEPEGEGQRVGPVGRR
jgi:hypothetical protein